MKNINMSIIRNIAWIFSNLARGTPYPPYEKVRGMLPAIASFIELKDEGVICDSIWALSYLTFGEENQLQDVLDLKILDKIIQLMRHEDIRTSMPALRTVGNLMTGNEKQTDVRKKNPWKELCIEKPL
jgi:hypothetical protein